MKKVHEHKGIEDLHKNISLTLEEKDTMFARISAYADAHPLPKAEPWHSRLFFGYSVYRYAYTTIGVTLCVLMLGGGAILTAAENALPGDSLYPIKIHINEALQGAFKVDAEAKIAWQEQRAMRRLEEAETLAKRGTLDADKRMAIEKEFEKNVNDFVRASVAIEKKEREKNNHKDHVVAKLESKTAKIQDARRKFEARVARQMEKIKNKKHISGSASVTSQAQDTQIDSLELKVKQKIEVMNADKTIERGTVEVKIEKVEVKTPIKTDWLKNR